MRPSKDIVYCKRRIGKDGRNQRECREVKMVVKGKTNAYKKRLETIVPHQIRSEGKANS